MFAVEDDAVQLTWVTLPPGVVRARAGSTVIDLGPAPPGRAGAADLGDLPAATLLDVALERADGSVAWHQPAHTLAPPPGRELFRFATISDMHLGEDRFGYRGTIVERPPVAEAYSVRATRGALGELKAWGAQLLVVKGDVTESGQPGQWDIFGALLRDLDRPALGTPGNHDGIEDPEPTGWRHAVGPHRRIEPTSAIAPREGLRRIGLGSTGRVQVRDEPGIRILLIDTTIAHRRDGQIAVATDDVVSAIAESDRPVWLGLHHQLMTFPFATYLPVGIPHDEAVRFLDRAVHARSDLLISSGHTHRNRRRAHGPAVITEVGSPKDYPGVWAGYVVHEGGIRQVVRRVATPDVLTWTDRSAGAAHGLWGVWSPGRLDQRCFTHTWPRPGPSDRTSP